MTVIAWDGFTLAADRLANMNGLKASVSKLRRINGNLVGGAGDLSVLMALFHWYEQGADPKNLPDGQRDKDRWSSLLIITPEKKIYKIEQDGYPFLINEPFFAIGTGRDFAIATMLLGFSARKAVQVASKYDAGCGLGVDTLTFKRGRV